MSVVLSSTFAATAHSMWSSLRYETRHRPESRESQPITVSKMPEQLPKLPSILNHSSLSSFSSSSTSSSSERSTIELTDSFAELVASPLPHPHRSARITLPPISALTSGLPPFATADRAHGLSHLNAWSTALAAPALPRSARTSMTSPSTEPMLHHGGPTAEDLYRRPETHRYTNDSPLDIRSQQAPLQQRTSPLMSLQRASPTSSSLGSARMHPYHSPDHDHHRATSDKSHPPSRGSYFSSPQPFNPTLASGLTVPEAELLPLRRSSTPSNNAKVMVS